ncbi:UNVERIFIED_CONTAM: hypothetical protein GTU68_061267 [Idotea baltica]|nr:hypothetical protein [Idotea baltica]
MAKKKTKKQPESTFEESVDQLQQIVGDLESGALGLEESLARFEEGTGLLRSCYSFLESAEQKIELLTRLSDDGEAETEPFDAETSVDKAAAKRKTRKAKPKAKPAAPIKASDTSPADETSDDEIAADDDVRSLFD